MKEKSLPQNLSDLPKWAQSEVNILIMRLNEANKELKRIKENPESNTIVGFAHSMEGESLHYLKNNQSITFRLPLGEVEARIKNDILEISESGLSDGSLFIKPQVSNVIQIHLKADNMIKDNSIESLQDAIKQYQENQDRHFLFPNDKSAFKAGATWQAEQYKDLIQSHAELLEALKTMYDSCRPEDVTKNKVSNGINLGEFYVGGCGTPSEKSIHKAKTAIEKANSIINKK